MHPISSYHNPIKSVTILPLSEYPDTRFASRVANADFEQGRHFRHRNRLAEGNEKNLWLECHDDGHAFGSYHVSHGVGCHQVAWALVLNSDFLSFFGADVNGFFDV